MAKTMRIQVLMEPETLLNVKNFCVENKIPYRNDSQMICALLNRSVRDIGSLNLTIYVMKEQLEQKKKEVQDLLNQIDAQTIRCTDLDKENKILKTNLKKKVKK